MYKGALSVFFDDYEWIHLTLGVFGNALFFGGSVLFLFEPLKRFGIYAFIAGSFFMLVGSVGQASVRYARDGS